VRHYRRCHDSNSRRVPAAGCRINTSSPTGFARGQNWLLLLCGEMSLPLCVETSTLVELACSMRGLLSSALFINARNAAETSNRGKQF
jgi:hypothetical protein